MDENYRKIVELIARSSGLNVNDVEEKVIAKQQKISGMISKEGAAQIVAAELGVSFEDEKVKLNELSPAVKRVNTLGKVIQLFPVRTFQRNGQENKVVNFMIADETSNTRVVLWDTHHISLIESGKIAEGSVVEILNASLREGEIHLGNFSEIKPSEEKIENAITEKIVQEKNISDFKVSDSIQTRAFIVQIFEPRFFNVCPECKKKAFPEGEDFKCEKHGKIIPEKRALINLVLDDGTETTRAVLFSEGIQSIGLNLEANFAEEKEKFLGKEMNFSGSVRFNKYFNVPELFVEGAKDIDVDKLISDLEAK